MNRYERWLHEREKLDPPKEEAGESLKLYGIEVDYCVGDGDAWVLAREYTAINRRLETYLTLLRNRIR